MSNSFFGIDSCFRPLGIINSGLTQAAAIPKGKGIALFTAIVNFDQDGVA